MSEHENGLSRRKRVVLCRGQYCNMGRRADKLYTRLEQVVNELNGDAYPRPIKLETASCLSMCGAGPNLIIYPEGIICNRIDETRLEQIIVQYLQPDLREENP